MQVAVIGGGVIGVCTAYFLAEAGHEVVVVERRNNVAELASFGTTGVASLASLSPWAAPGMAKTLLSCMFKSVSPISFRPTTNRAFWRWLKQWLSECESDRYLVNRERMQRIGHYSREVLHSLREKQQLDYEQSKGCLHLFRSERELDPAQAGIAMLAEQGVLHQLLDASGARTVEPALAADAPIAAALHLPQEESGNCPLFTKQMRYAAQALGTEFHFHSNVKTIEPHADKVGLVIDDHTFYADAVVVAAGSESAALLGELGIRVPLQPVKGYSATAQIKNFDDAPIATVMDDTFKVAITRMGNRVRLAGISELGADDLLLRNAALRTLIKVGDDWFPHASNYRNANFWCGMRPMLPDGPPLIGATPVRRVFVNIGHGAAGWAMAAGSGKLVADIVGGKQPDIDIDGLTLSRYG